MTESMPKSTSTKDWRIFHGDGNPHDFTLPEPPHWRQFGATKMNVDRGRLKFQIDDKAIDLVNAALLLRRPLLVTGRPGTGKTSLAYAVAHELQLGEVLVWPITSRSMLQESLYRYDAIGRLQDANFRRAKSGDDVNTVSRLKEPYLGDFIRLGPLGTALLPSVKPRVLLIDEIDKSDIDLPNDLLHIFEEGRYEIPELARLPAKVSRVDVFTHDSQEKVTIERGTVVCASFPFVVITSNGERELPPAFLRRCLRLDLAPPNPEMLKRIVEAHFGAEILSKEEQLNALLTDFDERRMGGYLATDQLLNAIYLTLNRVTLNESIEGNNRKDTDVKSKTLADFVLHYLSSV
jgi:MoxR-like ATPase